MSFLQDAYSRTWPVPKLRQREARGDTSDEIAHESTATRAVVGKAVRREADTRGTVGTPSEPEDELTEHEYVYGPEYADEFVLESYLDSGGNQQPLHILQDANP